MLSLGPHTLTSAGVETEEFQERACRSFQLVDLVEFGFEWKMSVWRPLLLFEGVAGGEELIPAHSFVESISFLNEIGSSLAEEFWVLA
ncbi:hypothetical protein Droror1_Dr00018208 [Drosera rotundifolia]